MQGSSALDNYDAIIAKKSLQMLLIDRSNEFRELAHGMSYPTNTKDWETIILNFCLDFNDCFKVWSGQNTPSDHNVIHKCFTVKFKDFKILMCLRISKTWDSSEK